jgi:dehydrogenase/reductase SDR family member 1
MSSPRVERPRSAEARERLDLLVNCAWGGYERMVEAGQFTWSLPFWQQPLHRWTPMMDAGARAAFVCSAFAAPIMISQGNGLIVNISYWAARKHIGNTLYGMSKAATDKMSSDMGQELRPHRVAVISLYPGLVRTEAVMEAARNGWLDISNSESPEYLGRVISVLVNDQRLMDKSGQALVAAVIGREYGVQDVDGRFPEPLTLSTS